MYQYTPFSVSVSVYSPATLASSAAILTQALAVKDAKVCVPLAASCDLPVVGFHHVRRNSNGREKGKTKLRQESCLGSSVEFRLPCTDTLQVDYGSLTGMLGVENRDFFSEPWVVADSDSLGFLQSRGCSSKDLPRNVQEFRTPMNPTLRDLDQFGSGPTAAQDPDLNQCPNRAKGRRSRPGECHLTVELANGTIS
ncbi:uncharacterized protein CCOS01_08642 [Colletotrichum costaricense]|uniref:Uncharacterized protein n=2 Tax=Colletotrichum acutatum species complex TaxID=2707335 RepID=A0AAJ0E0L0_9PEZI|nr:uncharacterized protein CCOS01_08642 [Colletotrichum costaricense]XP_060385347.1 uncharacterized protein CTAM01_03896 [Colletotrichum tamarilloi]KAI3543959.1 hypothetical protein CSPX01_05974 [Colletotrichum filicis]KAK1504589.1 hypothetical protein CTAM01_03896 [Colletotrichum tamarilloi]KAK1526224.1 hypothetical protein CCOS01_08642 [Colletotrichum costaricense]